LQACKTSNKTSNETTEIGSRVEESYRVEQRGDTYTLLRRNGDKALETAFEKAGMFSISELEKCSASG
jgi:hypothetical protein